jgi:transcriptional regulator with XRE-family HTH domain
MNDATQAGTAELANKISRLVRERGWNQEDFARSTRLNRQTIRQIMNPDARTVGDRRLRNATVGACAQALGLTVTELETLPLERLLSRMHADAKTDGDTKLRRLYEQATQPELLAWMERNSERAKQLSAEEIDELLSLQGTGGPLTTLGVEHYVGQIERKRKLHQKVSAIAGTEYLDLLEQLVDLMYDKVQPYGNRV